MKKIIIAGLFSFCCIFAFAADHCSADCHKNEHKCTAACHKNGAGHISNHGEKVHMCAKESCKHDCSKDCIKK